MLQKSCQNAVSIKQLNEHNILNLSTVLLQNVVGKLIIAVHSKYL